MRDYLYMQRSYYYIPPFLLFFFLALLFLIGGTTGIAWLCVCVCAGPPDGIAHRDYVSQVVVVSFPVPSTLKSGSRWNSGGSKKRQTDTDMRAYRIKTGVYKRATIYGEENPFECSSLNKRTGLKERRIILCIESYTAPT